MIKIGILGGAGYTAGELIRLLLNHPEAELVFVNSESNAGNLLTDVHEGLYGETVMTFTSEMPFDQVDVVFFCFGHGKSEAFLKEHKIPANVKIIDLAQDFRLAAPGNDYVYGLPEINKAQIATAQHVANPGCFATCIQLGLLPAASLGIIKSDVAVNAIRCRAKARCHNTLLLAQQQHEHLQGFSAPARSGNQAESETGARTFGS